jgi:TonB family protein
MKKILLLASMIAFTVTFLLITSCGKHDKTSTTQQRGEIAAAGNNTQQEPALSTVTIRETINDEKEDDFHPFLFILIFFGAFAFLGLVYSNIAKCSIDWNLNPGDFFRKFKERKGFWDLLIPIAALWIIIFNFFATALWMIVLLGKVLVRACSWIYQEILVPGLFLIARLFWHYFIVWPWRIFNMAFAAIPKSAKFKYYRIGFTGLLFSLFIGFMGRFLVVHHSVPLAWLYIFSILSLFPIGIAYSFIVYERISENNERPGKSKWTIVKYMLFLLVPFFIGFGLEIIISYAGSSSFYPAAFSSLLSGANLFLSSIIIINAILLIFMLSVLPSFVYEFTGSTKSFFREFSKHLYHKWLQYLVAFPSAMIPIVILSLLPIFFMSGIAYITGKTTEEVLADKSNTLREKISAMHPFNTYENLLEYNLIKDDSLKKLAEAEKQRLKYRIKLENVNYLRDSLFGKALRSYSSKAGALPLTALLQWSDRYLEFQEHAIPVANIRSKMKNARGTTDDSHTYQNMQTGLKMLDKASELEINSAEKEIESLKRELDNVCVIRTPKMEGKSVSSVRIEKEESGKADQCEVLRKELQNQIRKKSQEKQHYERRKARISLVGSYVKEFQEAEEEYYHKTEKDLSWGIILMGFWLSVLAAMGLGYVLSLTGNLNYSIFHIDDKEKTWYITQAIRTEKVRNPNQPLLGIVISGILILFLILFLVLQLYKNVCSDKLHWDSMKGCEKTIESSIQANSLLHFTRPFEWSIFTPVKMLFAPLAAILPEFSSSLANSETSEFMKAPPVRSLENEPGDAYLESKSEEPNPENYDQSLLQEDSVTVGNPAGYDTLQNITGEPLETSQADMNSDNSLNKTTTPDDKIFLVSDVPPKFPGGKEPYLRFRKENLKYPVEAKEYCVQGKVTVSFVVEKDGSLTDIKVVKGLGRGCDEEALRFVRSMPPWIPGRNSNETVRVRFNLPVEFLLY